MIISISGNIGSGKTTVAKLLAKRLGYNHYYIGGIRRDMAKKRGMTLEEYNKVGETDPTTDNKVDDYQKTLGETEDDFIIEGRTSFHFIPQSIKAYIKVDEEVGAKRVWKDLEKNAEKRNEANVSSYEELLQSIKNRIQSDIKRYTQYYGFDCYQESHYDIVIDSTNLTPDEVVEELLHEIEKRK